MFAVCNASVTLAELELESLFWQARRSSRLQEWRSEDHDAKA